jgi:hypothetical protein
VVAIILKVAVPQFQEDIVDLANNGARQTVGRKTIPIKTVDKDIASHDGEQDQKEEVEKTCCIQ